MSYDEREVCIQLIKGIQDKDHQERVLTLGDSLTLDKALAHLEALEAGKLSRRQLEEGTRASVNLVKTEHQQMKSINRW